MSTVHVLGSNETECALAVKPKSHGQASPILSASAFTAFLQIGVTSSFPVSRLSQPWIWLWEIGLLFPSNTSVASRRLVGQIQQSRTIARDLDIWATTLRWLSEPRTTGREWIPVKSRESQTLTITNVHGSPVMLVLEMPTRMNTSPISTCGVLAMGRSRVCKLFADAEQLYRDTITAAFYRL